MRKKIQAVSEGKSTKPFTAKALVEFFTTYFYSVCHATEVNVEKSFDNGSRVEVDFRVGVREDEFPPDSIKNKITKKIEMYFDPFSSGVSSFHVGGFNALLGPVTQPDVMYFTLSITGEKDRNFKSKGTVDAEIKKQTDFEDKNSGKW